MHLLFNCDRALAHVAADASLRSRLKDVGGAATSARHVGCSTALAQSRTIALRAADPLHERLGELVRATVVGEPVELHLALAADAVGWSPSGAFTYRDQAVTLSLESVSSLVVEEFHIESLSWQEPMVSAEWRLVARQSEPLLIDEDILVEPNDRLVVLCRGHDRRDPLRSSRGPAHLLRRRGADRADPPDVLRIGASGGQPMSRRPASAPRVQWPYPEPERGGRLGHRDPWWNVRAPDFVGGRENSDVEPGDLVRHDRTCRRPHRAPPGTATTHRP